ncbi:MAG: flavodoxin domain-containing protein [Bacteroidales bacterium]|nr:flavodoxin domain-containing protein [Bacteroidales bacterium]
MKRVNILSWPIGGETEKVAHLLLEHFNNNAEIKALELDFLTVDEQKLKSCDLLVVGGSTVGADNWSTADNTTKWGHLFSLLRLTDLSGLKAAIFGLGDQKLFPDNFVDGMSVVKKVLELKGAKIVGYWSTENYEFNDSRSIDGDDFVGLALDTENQSELTEIRIQSWVDQVIHEIGI